MITLERSKFFVAGGTLPRNAPCYVERSADALLLDLLTQGDFCYVLTARQMGKSSLMARTANLLRNQHHRTVILDLTEIGQNLNAEQWYTGLAASVAEQLDRESEGQHVWAEKAAMGPCQRFFSLLDVLLASLRSKEEERKDTPQTETRGLGSQLVIFIDEIDTVRSLPFSTDEFFAAVRAAHNRRNREDESSNITFCLLGVASPSDLIRDTRLTPFNIGHRVELHDFTRKEIRPLAEGLTRGALSSERAAAVLDRVMYWTKGHPYLTQRMCLALAHFDSLTVASVDLECAKLFLSRQALTQDDNLAFVRDRLLRNEMDLAALLALYERVLHGRTVLDDAANPLVSALKLSGVVSSAERGLAVRNRIYAHVFNRKWVKDHLPQAELRRQRAAYWKGVLRTSLFAVVVLGLVSQLALFASRQARLAEERAGLAEAERHNAEREARRAEQAADRAHAAATRLDIERSEMLFDTGQSSRAIASLARLLRQQPTNTFVANRLLSSLTSRTFCLLVATLSHPEKDRRDSMGGERAFIAAASFSRDGEWVVTAGSDGAARLWQAVDGTPWKGPLLHKAEVTGADFSPDSARLLTVSSDQTARLWDVRTGRAIGAPWQHPSNVISGLFLPDGKRAITACGDRLIRLWDVETGNQLLSDFPPTKAYSMALSGDGRRLIVQSSGSKAVVFDVQTAEVIGKLDHRIQSSRVDMVPQLNEDGSMAACCYPFYGRLFSLAPKPHLTGKLLHPLHVNCVRFSPDGGFVASGAQDGTARVWSTLKGEPVGPPLKHEHSVFSLKFSPDGTRLITASRDRRVRIWDFKTGGLVSEPLHHDARVNYVELSADGSRALTLTENNLVRIWAVRHSGALPVRKRFGNDTTRIRFRADGRAVATASWDGLATVWDPLTGQNLFPPLKLQGINVDEVQFSPDGKYLVACSQQGKARVWSATDGSLIINSLDHSWVQADFSPDSTRLLTRTYAGSSSVKIWNLPTGVLDFELHHPGSIRYARYSPDGRRIVTASTDKTARLWDVVARKQIGEPMSHSGEVDCAVFSPRGDKLITCSRDRTARIWDARTGRSAPERVLQHQDELAGVFAADFSPDGKWVVTAAGTSAQVWDVSTGQPRNSPLRHADRINTVCFGPDGRLVLTTSKDGTARVWNTSTGYLAQEPLAHSMEVFHASFSPDGRRIATCGADAICRIWNVPSMFGAPPEWLPDLAETLAGHAIDGQEIARVVVPEELLSLKQTLLQGSPGTDSYESWAHWFFAEARERFINPHSTVSLSAYLEGLASSDKVEDLEEALRWFPKNSAFGTALKAAIASRDGASKPAVR